MKTSAIIAALFASTVFAPVHAYAQDSQREDDPVPINGLGWR